jgi:lipid A 3-O-deacylase
MTELKRISVLCSGVVFLTHITFAQKNTPKFFTPITWQASETIADSWVSSGKDSTFLVVAAETTNLKAPVNTENPETIKPLQGPQFNNIYKLDVQNDMLVPREKTDRYFSSGLRLDYTFARNSEKKAWYSQIFPKLKSSDNYYGMMVLANMYTPASRSAEMVKGDRPYAGLLYAGLTNISTSEADQTRFQTEYGVGVIGPAAQQEYFQKTWHKVIDRPQPLGWENQIVNDLALNVNFQIEKRAIRLVKQLDVTALVEANVGTITNYFGAGGMVRIGWFDDYFKNPTAIRKIAKGDKTTACWQAFAFFKPIVRFVADNSLLQGGAFTDGKSPNTISKDDMSYSYFNGEMGYCIAYRNINMTYSQLFRTAEFRNAKNMQWGCFTFSVGF